MKTKLRQTWRKGSESVAILIFFFGLFAVVPLLEHVEGFLLFALVAEEALTVVVVLNAGQYATGRTEILQNPGRSAG